MKNIKKENDVNVLKKVLLWLTGFISVGALDGGFSLGISEGIYFLLGIGVIICLVWSLKIVFRLDK